MVEKVGLKEGTYTLTNEDIEKLVKMGIGETHSAHRWGEGVDYPVLWLRIQQELDNVVV